MKIVLNLVKTIFLASLFPTFLSLFLLYVIINFLIDLCSNLKAAATLSEQDYERDKINRENERYHDAFEFFIGYCKAMVDW